MKKFWYRAWYNVWFRMFVVLVPTYFIVLIPALYLIRVPAEYMSNILSLIYFLVFCLAMIDNDFSKLNEVGLDVDGKPLKKDD